MRSSLLATAFIAAVVALAIADGDSGVSTWLRLRQEISISGGRIEALQRETTRLQSEIEALEQDPFALEQAIREELELARPGEVVVRFERLTGTGRPLFD